MLAQAAGLALFAAMSPTAILIGAVYLGSARPRQTVLCYLAGAVVVATIAGVVVLVALRAGHLELRSARTPRYGLRLGLGLAMLTAGAVVSRHKPRLQPGPRPSKGIVSRLVAEPAPATALLAGALVFAPSLTFLAAVQVIATAQASDLLSALGLAMVIVIDVMFVWLPFLAYVSAPQRTTRLLGAFNSWLRVHGRPVLAATLAVAGTLLAIDGFAGLISRLAG